MCFCNPGILGDACDVVGLDLKFDSSGVAMGSQVTLSQNEHQYVQIVVSDDNIEGRRMVVSLKGMSRWVGISINKGIRRPEPSSPRACDFHNYLDNLQEKIEPKVQVPVLDSPVYTVMVRNTCSGQARFSLKIRYEGEPSKTNVEIVDKVAAKLDIQHMTGNDEPFVPLDVLGADGSLPRSVLILSSRTGVTGMASSKEMILVKVDEFCSQGEGPSGMFYTRCSNIQGTMTICSDRVAKVYYDMRSALQPKETADFKKMTLTRWGKPQKFWAHLPSWQDNCRYHATIKIDEHNLYVGVSSQEQGKFVHINAIMRGKSGWFFNDQGELHWWYLHGATATVSSLVTAAIEGLIFGGYCWRKKIKKRRKQEAQACEELAKWHGENSIPPTFTPPGSRAFGEPDASASACNSWKDAPPAARPWHTGALPTGSLEEGDAVEMAQFCRATSGERQRINTEDSTIDLSALRSTKGSMAPTGRRLESLRG